MGNRHKSREFALQILYAVDVSGNEAAHVRDFFWESLTAPDEVRVFADELVDGVLRDMGRIDRIITHFSEHWTMDRMTAVDRNILRMAVFELLSVEGIPHSVTINEAVEIGKKFGSEDSGAFVNGILDHVAKDGAGIDAALLGPAPAIREGLVKVVAPSAPPPDESDEPETDDDKRHRERREAIAKAGSQRKMRVGSLVKVRRRDHP
jgi:N utilization substance protein B